MALWTSKRRSYGALTASLLALAGALTLGSSGSQAATIDRTFTNYIKHHGQDPSIVYTGGYYYLIQSGMSSNGLVADKTVRAYRSRWLNGLKQAESKILFEIPDFGNNGD